MTLKNFILKMLGSMLITLGALIAWPFVAIATWMLAAFLEPANGQEMPVISALFVACPALIVTAATLAATVRLWRLKKEEPPSRASH